MLVRSNFSAKIKTMKSAFKTYDIRGVYPSEINEELAYLVGRAFLPGSSIVVGRDGRESSPKLMEEVCRGIIDSGGEVVDIGLTNTPLLNFTVAHYGYDGGVMVTASHNPARFNGLKLIKEKALQVYGEEIEELRKKIEKKEFRKGKGKKTTFNPLPLYLGHINAFCGDFRDIKIVLDFANGVGAVTAEPLFSMLPAESSFMNAEIDGSFPHYEANPHDLSNLKKLQERVVKQKAHMGVFFDGDGDRSIIVDENGDIVSMDGWVSLLAKEELRDQKGEKVYYDLRFSKSVEEEIREHGGEPVMMRVGNPFYKEKLILEGGVLGAELSGHIMFKDNYCIDDGLFAVIKTMNLLKSPLSSMIHKRHYQSEEISIEVKDKDKVFEKVKDAFREGESFHIDGIYIQFKDWWFNLRKSNTEDLVRLRLEAEKEDLLEEKKKELISLIKNEQ